MRNRLILAFTLVIVIALGTVLLVANFSAETQVRGYLRRFGMGNSDAFIQSLSEYYRQHQGWLGVETFFNSQAVQPKGQGRSQGSGPGSNREAGFQSQNILADQNGVIIYAPDPARIGQSLNESELQTSQSIMDNGITIGYLLSPNGVNNLPANFEIQLIAKVRNATLLAALISGGVALILAVILANQVVKPINTLTLAAEKISHGDLSHRVRVSGSPEIKTLGETLNIMTESLNRSEKSRRALTADIAHELRTPLAVQRANLEALEDGVYPLNQEALKPLLEQNELLVRLVEDLRTLSLADAGDLSLNKRPVNLLELCQETVQSFEPTFAKSRITFQIDSQRELPLVDADPERIQQILHNILQNALRYTPAGRSIEISLYQEQEQVRLDIRDHGPGIPLDQLDLIFERFYRVTSDHESTSASTGLGLAIARKLAEAHGGTLTAANHPQGGAIFTLRLPL